MTLPLLHHARQPAQPTGNTSGKESVATCLMAGQPVLAAPAALRIAKIRSSVDLAAARLHAEADEAPHPEVWVHAHFLGEEPARAHALSAGEQWEESSRTTGLPVLISHSSHTPANTLAKDYRPGLELGVPFPSNWEYAA